jgi:hypothetical protein
VRPPGFGGTVAFGAGLGVAEVVECTVVEGGVDVGCPVVAADG